MLNCATSPRILSPHSSNVMRMKKLKASLLAGFLAASVNTVVLKLAGAFNIEAESGGLFRLLRIYLGDTFNALRIGKLWTALLLPEPGTFGFWLLFHTFMGLVMAVFYAYAIEPLLGGQGWRKGAIYSLLPWLLNSAVVMPLLGKGFAASHSLTLLGMMYFFVANGTYAVLLGLLYEKFMRFPKVES